MQRPSAINLTTPEQSHFLARRDNGVQEHSIRWSGGSLSKRAISVSANPRKAAAFFKAVQGSRADEAKCTLRGAH
jgi:hypothetical protein